MSIQLGNKKWILLPVEIKVREFEAKLLFSFFAAEAGYGVVVGPNLFNLENESIPQGLYFDKSISPNKRNMIQAQISKGNLVACLDEEGVVYKSDSEYVRQRLSAENLDNASLVCAWGEAQSSVIADFHPKAKKKTFITGSMRVDLMRPDFRSFYDAEVKKLKERFGPFILIPSNFSAPNHANGPDFIVRQFIACGYARTKEEIDFLKERIAYQAKLLDSFLDLLPKIAAEFPHHKVIIRPHPGDNQKTWEEAVKPLENVMSVYEGSITPWILAAEAFVHNSCSTGVEAAIMGLPAIAYMPYCDERFEQNIPNSVSLQATDEASLFELIREVLSGDKKSPPNVSKGILSHHVESLEGEFACQRILTALDSLPLQASSFVFGEKKEFSLSSLSQLLLQEVRRLARIGKRFFIPSTAQSTQAYKKQKFPGFDKSEVEEILGLLRSISGRFENIKITQLGKDLVVIANGD